MKWYIPDCFWHSKSNGVFVSHEAICILNTNDTPVKVNITLYFEDRDKLPGYSVEVGAERPLHIRMDQLKNTDGTPVPQDTPYAAVVECEKNITIQYTRVDTSQPEMAIATAII